MRELRRGRKATLRGAPTLDDRNEFEKNQQGEPPLSDATAPPSFVVQGLRSLTLLQFRVRAINAHGPGPWTAPTERVRTTAVCSLTACCPRGVS